MQNPFAELGLDNGASTEQVRAAYHAQVKRCHPDVLREEKARRQAESAMVRLNLAYAEALRQAAHREAGGVVIADAMQVARKLQEQGHYDGALRILARASAQDAAWYALKGAILMKKGEPEAAYECFRQAARLSPETTKYRELALDACVMMRKQKTFRGRMSCWARGLKSKMS